MQRHERFSQEYLSQLDNLSQVLISYVLIKYKEMPLETKELNQNLANFFKVNVSFACPSESASVFFLLAMPVTNR